MIRITDLNFTFGAGDTTKSLVIRDVLTDKAKPISFSEALALGINLVAPSFTSNPTFGISVLDNGQNELVNKAGYADGTSHYITLDVPVSERSALLLTLSAAPSGTGGTVNGTLWIDE